MGEADEGHENALVYGQRMRALFEACGRPPDVTQKRLAAALFIAEGTLSRYLAGKRIAPERILDLFIAFLADHGQPLDDRERTGLHELREEAQRTSSQPAVRLAYTQGVVRKLRAEVAQLIQEQEQERAVRQARERAAAADLAEERGLRRAEADAADKELEAAREELDRERVRAERQEAATAEELVSLRSRLTVAEQERGRLVELVRVQEKKLRDAASYSRGIEDDYSRVREKAADLARELATVRHQVEMLNAEQVHPTAAHVLRLAGAPGELRVTPTVSAPETPAAIASQQTTGTPAVPPPRRNTPSGERRPPGRLRARWTGFPNDREASNRRRRRRVLMLVAAVAALSVGVARWPGEHRDATADLYAPACAVASPLQEGCVVHEKGQVTDKHSEGSDPPDLDLTILHESGHSATYTVGGDIYNAAQHGSTADLKIWKGRVTAITVAGKTDRQPADLDWPEIWTALLIGLGTALSGYTLLRWRRGPNQMSVIGILFAAAWTGLVAAISLGVTTLLALLGGAAFWLFGAAIAAVFIGIE
ncbi:hypothetical protein ACFCX4_05395 [Kitasatospora sp. NPDC056327]|uniref:hypothetical protein n=1 Tax=Kitasatospora sp. NPDC056327 TaxID=3345785 RepID=UPI0035DB56D7